MGRTAFYYTYRVNKEFYVLYLFGEVWSIWRSRQYSTAKESIFYRWVSEQTHLHGAVAEAVLRGLRKNSSPGRKSVNTYEQSWTNRVCHIPSSSTSDFVILRCHPKGQWTPQGTMDTPRDNLNLETIGSSPGRKFNNTRNWRSSGSQRSWLSSRSTRNRRSRSNWVHHLPNPSAYKFVSLQVRYRPSLLSTAEVTLNWKL